MCSPTSIVSSIGLLGSVFQTISSTNANAQAAENAKAQAEYNSSINLRNAELAEINAKDVLIKGQNEQEEARRKYQAEVGNLATKYGAGNIELSSGSALNALADQTELGELSALEIGTNSNREAQNYLIQAGDAKNASQLNLQEGELAADNYMSKATNSLLTGAENIVSQYPFAKSNDSLVKKGPNYF